MFVTDEGGLHRLKIIDFENLGNLGIFKNSNKVEECKNGAKKSLKKWVLHKHG